MWYSGANETSASRVDFIILGIGINININYNQLRRILIIPHIFSYRNREKNFPAE